MHARMCVCMPARMYALHACMYVCMRACMHARMYVCMSLLNLMRVPARLCACCVCARACVCVCLYISPRNSKPTSFICNICVFLFCKREISELPLTRRPIHQKATHLCKSRTSRRHADTLPPTHSQAFFLALSLFALGSSRAGRA